MSQSLIYEPLNHLKLEYFIVLWGVYKATTYCVVVSITYDARYTVVFFYVFATIPPLPFARKRNEFFARFLHNFSIDFTRWRIRLLFMAGKTFFFFNSAFPLSYAASSPSPRTAPANWKRYNLDTFSQASKLLREQGGRSLIKMNLRGKIETFLPLPYLPMRGEAKNKGMRDNKIRCSKQYRFDAMNI